VADIPPLPAMSLRAAWNSAATCSETGSSRMSANAAVGKDTAGSLGDADAAFGTDGSTEAAVSVRSGAGAHPASAMSRANPSCGPW
jgi:hypothetical protein